MPDARKLRRWSSDIDAATIPDAVLASERARRNSARRTVRTGGRNGGRPVQMIDCPRGCGHRAGKTAMRAHERECAGGR